MTRLKKVCIFGPESTGKSMLTERLAQHFNASFVPEYAKEVIDAQKGEIFYPDIERIARGQMASEAAIAATEPRLLFCDTDLITTSIWSDWLFNDCPEWILQAADQQNYDLYLLTDVDVPWVDDLHRYFPEEREKFMARCREELEKRDLDYVQISGGWEQRFVAARDAVNTLLNKS